LPPCQADGFIGPDLLPGSRTAAIPHKEVQAAIARFEARRGARQASRHPGAGRADARRYMDMGHHRGRAAIRRVPAGTQRLRELFEDGPEDAEPGWRRRETLRITVDARDNVAVVVNPGGLP
jgi:hypothetical protein